MLVYVAYAGRLWFHIHALIVQSFLERTYWRRDDNNDKCIVLRQVLLFNKNERVIEKGKEK